MNKTLLIVLTLLVILIGGGSSYYFLSSREGNVYEKGILKKDNFKSNEDNKNDEDPLEEMEGLRTGIYINFFFFVIYVCIFFVFYYIFKKEELEELENKSKKVIDNIKTDQRNGIQRDIKEYFRDFKITNGNFIAFGFLIISYIFNIIVILVCDFLYLSEVYFLKKKNLFKKISFKHICILLLCIFFFPLALPAAIFLIGKIIDEKLKKNILYYYVHE